MSRNNSSVILEIQMVEKGVVGLFKSHFGFHVSIRKRLRGKGRSLCRASIAKRSVVLRFLRQYLKHGIVKVPQAMAAIVLLTSQDKRDKLLAAKTIKRFNKVGSKALTR